jgi:genome maintenance exonuclease 1
MLCHPGLYAGTTDLVGVWKGKQAIMDFKQTNKPKKREWIDDYFMQGAAYALAHNELYETNIENIAIFMCSGACEWQLFECGEEEFPLWEVAWAKRLEKYYGFNVGQRVKFLKRSGSEYIEGVIEYFDPPRVIIRYQNNFLR